MEYLKGNAPHARAWGIEQNLMISDVDCLMKLLYVFFWKNWNSCWTAASFLLPYEHIFPLPLPRFQGRSFRFGCHRCWQGRREPFWRYTEQLWFNSALDKIIHSFTILRNKSCLCVGFHFPGWHLGLLLQVEAGKSPTTDRPLEDQREWGLIMNKPDLHNHLNGWNRQGWVLLNCCTTSKQSYFTQCWFNTSCYLLHNAVQSFGIGQFASNMETRWKQHLWMMQRQLLALSQNVSGNLGRKQSHPASI